MKRSIIFAAVLVLAALPAMAQGYLTPEQLEDFDQKGHCRVVDDLPAGACTLTDEPKCRAYQNGATLEFWTCQSSAWTITEGLKSAKVFDVTHPSYGATGDGVADDTAEVQAAIDAAEAAGGGVVWFPMTSGGGVYLCDEVTGPVDGIDWALSVSGDNITLAGERGATIKHTADATARMIFVWGGTPATWSSTQYCDATIYTISAASQHDMSITLATPAEYTNFTAGDFVLVRASQMGVGTNQTPGCEPDAEINEVVDVDTDGVISLRRPLAKAYAADVYPAGHDEAGNATPLGVSVVTDRTIHNLKIQGLTFDHNVSDGAVLAGGQVVGYEVVDNISTSEGPFQSQGNFRDAVLSRNRLHLTENTQGEKNYWLTPGTTGNTDVVCSENVLTSESHGVGYIHIHEGSARIKVLNNLLLNSNTSTNNTARSISVSARAYDIQIRGNTIINGGALDQIRVSADTGTNPVASNGIISDNLFYGTTTGLIRAMTIDQPAGAAAGLWVVEDNQYYNSLSANNIELGTVVDGKTTEIVTTGSPTLLATPGITQLDSSGGAITATQGDAIISPFPATNNIQTPTRLITMTDASTASTASITNHAEGDPTVYAFEAVDDTLILQWAGTEWVTILYSKAGVTSFGASIAFEGATQDAYETVFAITDPTATRTITFPDASGTVAFTQASTSTTTIREDCWGDDASNKFMLSGSDSRVGDTVRHGVYRNYTASATIGLDTAMGFAAAWVTDSDYALFTWLREVRAGVGTQDVEIRIFVGALQTDASANLLTTNEGTYFLCGSGDDVDGDGTPGSANDLKWWAVTQDGDTDHTGDICATLTGVQCDTYTATNTTATNTEVDCSTANVYHDLRIEQDSDDGEVRFYIGDVLKATHTTDIPAGSAWALAAVVSEAIDADAKSMLLDYLELTYDNP